MPLHGGNFSRIEAMRTYSTSNGMRPSALCLVFTRKGATGIEVAALIPAQPARHISAEKIANLQKGYGDLIDFDKATTGGEAVLSFVIPPLARPEDVRALAEEFGSQLHLHFGLRTECIPSIKH